MAKLRSRIDAGVQQIVVAIVIALIFGAFKLYTDVQALKLKFEYLNGQWDVPKEAKK
jgi:hypothetical protein